MKWLVLIILLLVVALFIFYRYRRQIQTVMHIWRMFKQLREQTKPPEKQIEKRNSEKETALVRCSRCGKWISQDNALNLRSKTFYCSSVCMEKAAEIRT